ncbi:hypothetical protein AUR04nite_02500 [Glutamicibacter uratoxydans]|uniref:Uncharacterized protein n=1 Tax=Glutamicibacter uratoxydans TaxID=43667 RepID=A0A4Y4DMZ5_GLUUR|nr:hypothetical protein AUR04nite_02500 [Glutamicibacter uratoxydans]
METYAQVELFRDYERADADHAFEHLFIDERVDRLANRFPGHAEMFSEHPFRWQAVTWLAVFSSMGSEDFADLAVLAQAAARV